MGVFTRSDSPYYWLWLETAIPSRQREKTAVKVGTTAHARRDNRQLVEQVYAQRMRELAAHVHRLPAEKPAIRFAAYATLYERDTVPHHRGAYREREMLKTLNTGLGPELLSLIDKARVVQWRTQRRQQVSARTVNREVDLLKSMLRDAVPTYLDASPIVGLKRLPVVPPKRRLMTPIEETKILRVLSREDRAIFLMGLDTLCRLGDILDLRREDDRGKTLYIQHPKASHDSSPYTVPVSTRLRKALNALPKAGDWYFPHRRHAPTDAARRCSVRTALERACEVVKVPYGRKRNGITFHWATRRTGATRMLQAGAKLKAVQEVGHWKRPDVMLDIYAESTSKEARRAVELVGRHSRVTPARSERRRNRA